MAKFMPPWSDIKLDAHAHIVQYGFKMQLRLDETRTLSGLLDLLEDYVASHPSDPDTWVEAMGWDQTRWTDTDGSFPTAVSPLSPFLCVTCISFCSGRSGFSSSPGLPSHRITPRRCARSVALSTSHRAHESTSQRDVPRLHPGRRDHS